MIHYSIPEHPHIPPLILADGGSYREHVTQDSSYAYRPPIVHPSGYVRLVCQRVTEKEWQRVNTDDDCPTINRYSYEQCTSTTTPQRR